jgi:hypothetical protein
MITVGAMERMRNLGKRFGFHEDAQILWLGVGDANMFWVFPLYLVFFHEGRVDRFSARS